MLHYRRLTYLACAVAGLTISACSMPGKQQPIDEVTTQEVVPVRVPLPVAAPTVPPAPRHGFDASINRVPPRFAGDDPVAVRAALLRLNLARGEFETTAQHAQRIDDLQDRQIVPGRTIRSVYAFSVPFQAPGRYDADAGVWPLYLTGPQWDPERFANSLFWTFIGGPLVRARDLTNQEGSYIGSNAFGAQTTVSRQRATDLRVKVCGTAETTCPTFTPQQLQMRIDAQEAAAIRQQGGLRMLVIGTLEAPFVSIDNWAHRPTMRDPMDIRTQSQVINIRGEEFIIYRQATGEILHRIPITHPRLR